MKHLLTTLTLSSLFFVTPATLAVRQLNIYLPIDQSCAVYKGKITSTQAFPIWIERNRQLMIETNSEFKVAVIYQNEIVSPYQVHSFKTSIISQYSYRTSNTGHYVISIEGKAQDAKITFCLN